jgi:hypothetical protein
VSGLLIFNTKGTKGTKGKATENAAWLRGSGDIEMICRIESTSGEYQEQDHV